MFFHACDEGEVVGDERDGDEGRRGQELQNPHGQELELASISAKQLRVEKPTCGNRPD